MTILVVPLQHRFAGTSRSRHRACFIPMPASAGGGARTSPQSSHRVRKQRPIRNHQRLSALFAKPSTATAAPTPNPHSRQALTAFPRVRSSEAFRRRPLYRVDRSRRAGIRNPSRNRTLSHGNMSSRVRPFRLRRYCRSGHRQRCCPRLLARPCLFGLAAGPRLAGGCFSPSRCLRRRKRTGRRRRTLAPSRPSQAASRAVPGPDPFEGRPASHRSRRLPKSRARVRRRSR